MAFAQVMVVHAQGPSAASYPAGSVLASNQSVHLLAGDVLQVLDSNGPRTILGPSAQSIGAAAHAASGNMVLAQLAAREHERRPNLGVARGNPPEPLGNNIWMVSPRAEAACASPGYTSGFFRSDTARAVEVEIAKGEDGAPVRLLWAAGSATLTWPKELPQQDGNEYRIKVDGRYSTTLVWHSVAPPSGDMDAFAKDLLANGCEDQFDVLTAPVNS